MVSEILSEVPRPQHWQFAVLVNHMKLLDAVLQHCSIPRERYSDTAALLHRTAVRMNSISENLCRETLQNTCFVVMVPTLKIRLARFLRCKLVFIMEFLGIW